MGKKGYFALRSIGAVMILEEGRNASRDGDGDGDARDWELFLSCSCRAQYDVQVRTVMAFKSLPSRTRSASEFSERTSVYFTRNASANVCNWSPARDMIVAACDWRSRDAARRCERNLGRRLYLTDSTGVAPIVRQGAQGRGTGSSKTE